MTLAIAPDATTYAENLVAATATSTLAYDAALAAANAILGGASPIQVVAVEVQNTIGGTTVAGVYVFIDDGALGTAAEQVIFLPGATLASIDFTNFI